MKPRKRRPKIVMEVLDEKVDPSSERIKSFVGHGNCAVCGAPLCTHGGCANTGMCGPCCTGDADTAGEY